MDCEPADKMMWWKGRGGLLENEFLRPAAGAGQS